MRLICPIPTLLLEVHEVKPSSPTSGGPRLHAHTAFLFTLAEEILQLINNASVVPRLDIPDYKGWSETPQSPAMIFFDSDASWFMSSYCFLMTIVQRGALLQWEFKSGCQSPSLIPDFNLNEPLAGVVESSNLEQFWVPGPIIVGAGPSGLATAASLKDKGVPSLILEKDTCIVSSWKLRTYERLKLHLPKQFCELPLLPFPSDFPTYPTREQFIFHKLLRILCSPLLNQHIARDEGSMCRV